MHTHKRLVRATALVLALLLVGGAMFVIRQMFFAPKTITAYFTTATAVYPGDDVKVSGMKVGTITAITPQGTQTALTLKVGRNVRIPDDAKAVIVAQNLLAARYVQLAPAYRSGQPTMADGAVIPVQRTAIPVEWDEVKQQLMRLATDLGPTSDVSSTSVARFIDSAADALGGNGAKVRTTLNQLAAVARILADGSGDIVGLISNLQTFITALRDSGEQMVQFQDRLATLSSVLNDSKSDLDAALTTLTVAIGDVHRFVAGRSIWRTSCTPHRTRSPTATESTTPTPVVPWAPLGSTTSPIRCNSSAARSGLSKTSPPPKPRNCVNSTLVPHYGC
jgi:virulence factor Mce-like protein